MIWGCCWFGESVPVAKAANRGGARAHHLAAAARALAQLVAHGQRHLRECTRWIKTRCWCRVVRGGGKGLTPPACAAMPTMWSVAVLRGAEHVLHGPAIGRVSKGLEMGVGGGLCASMGVTCDPGIVVHIPIGCGASARIGLRTSAWLRAARACTAGQLKACGGRQWW